MKSKTSNRWPKRTVDTFFNTWNPDMAYILGYFASDGSMYRNKRGSCYVAFTSVDKELITLVKEIMGISNKIEAYKAKRESNWKLRYTLQIGSKKLFDQLVKLGFTPKKSLTLKCPIIPDEFLGHFLRGYFDGDGCASFEQRKRKDRNNKIYSQIIIRITCGSKEFLETIQIKLNLMAGIGLGSLHKHGTIYDLAYSTQNVIKLYGLLYPSAKVPCLKRKREILERGLHEKLIGTVAQPD